MASSNDSSAAAASLAYEEIKRRVIECAYRPGAKLSEARLAEELGYGRSPIRTAFSRLQAEGWIEVSPQSGTYVKALTEREIEDIFEMRLLLESHVTHAAARNIDAEQLRRLRVAFDRLAPRGKAGDRDAFDDVEDFNELDSTFHSTIYRAAGNALMTATLLNLLEKARWLKKSFPSTPKRWKLAFDELGQVLACLEARDGRRAAQLMCEHIGNAADFAAGLRSREPGAKGRKAAA
jgi:GntR family transcriptional regulator, rspAB operon transcriptional repressor